MNYSAVFKFLSAKFDPLSENVVIYWIPGISIDEDQYLMIPAVEDVVENPAPLVDFSTGLLVSA